MEDRGAFFSLKDRAPFYRSPAPRKIPRSRRGETGAEGLGEERWNYEGLCYVSRDRTREKEGTRSALASVCIPAWERRRRRRRRTEQRHESREEDSSLAGCRSFSLRLPRDRISPFGFLDFEGLSVISVVLPCESSLSFFFLLFLFFPTYGS